MSDLLSILGDVLFAGYWLVLRDISRVLLDFLDSSFLAALLGTGVGAFVSQWAVERSERRRRALDEIRATNASINLAFAIANTALNLKAQHVKRTVEDYDRELTAFRAKHNRPVAGEISFFVDFMTLMPPALPIGALQQFLFEKVQLTGRPLVAFTVLTQAADGLKQAIERRNAIVLDCKTKAPADPALAALYFGVPDAKGRVDQTYANCLAAIARQTDDCFFFSRLLMEDLVRHGKAISSRLKNSPRIQEPDFSNVDTELIPDAKLYEAWLSGFRKPVSVQTEANWITKLSDALGSG